MKIHLVNSLFAKIALSVFVIFGLLSALLVASVDDSARALQLEANQKLHLKLATNIAKDSPLWLDQGLANKPVADALHMMMLIGPAMELYIVAPDGALLNYSDPEGKVVRKTISMTPITNFLKDSNMLPILGDDPRSPSGQKIFSVAPIYAVTPATVTDSLPTEQLPKPVAYLYIIIGGQQYDSVHAMLSSSHFAHLGISAILAGCVLCALVMLLLFFVLTRPLRRVVEGLADFHQLEFLKVPPTLPMGAANKHDELNQLTTTIHTMAELIVSQFQEMIRNRNLRQQLITHISHDLRTPLSSIRGYLESWQLSQAEQPNSASKHYVQIALRNCNQLEHMVDELFELSRLEANEIKPAPESFPLRELVDDIIQKLEIKAHEKDLQLLCQSTESLPLVEADIGHINRVLTNLIDNAIRHSKPSGQVVISLHLEAAQQRIHVKVVDTGTGIPAQELALLFEPYFRASNQDQHYKQGTGLGLAITKRLLLLNGSDIHVESQQHVGSVFSFWVTCGRKF